MNEYVRHKVTVRLYRDVGPQVMRYNGERMPLTEHEAYRRLRDAARRVEPALVVDRGSIHWIDGAYPGVEYNLILGDAHALLFMPAADIDGPEWQSRVGKRLEAAHEYLAVFPRPAGQRNLQERRA